MERRDYLRTTAGIATVGVVPLAGCAGSGDAGTLATYVSDQPGDIDDFESCVVTLSDVEVKPVDGDPVTRSLDGAEADLVQLQGETRKLVGETELDAGEYEYVHLAVTGVDATLDGGGDADVDTAGEAGLKFETFAVDGERSETFAVRADETASFTADFMPVERGQTGSYVLKPVAEEVTVTYSGTEATTTTA